MAYVDWKGKGVNPLVFARSCKFLLNKFFDSSTPSMRKVDDEGKNGGKKMLFIVATLLPVDHRNADQLERRTLVPKVDQRVQ